MFSPQSAQTSTGETTGTAGVTGTSEPTDVTETTETAETTEIVKTTETTETTTANRTNGSIPVGGGSVPTNPDRQFAAVQNLNGTDATPPNRIVFHERDEMYQFDESLTEFRRYLGFEPARRDIHAYVNESNVITVNASMKRTPVELEHVLAHEFYHVVQRRTGALETIQNAVEGDESDARLDGLLYAKGRFSVE